MLKFELFSYRMISLTYLPSCSYIQVANQILSHFCQVRDMRMSSPALSAPTTTEPDYGHMTSVLRVLLVTIVQLKVWSGEMTSHVTQVQHLIVCYWGIIP